MKIEVFKKEVEDDFEFQKYYSFKKGLDHVYTEGGVDGDDSSFRYIGDIFFKDGIVDEINIPRDDEDPVARIITGKIALFKAFEDDGEGSNKKESLTSFFDRNAFIKHVQLLGSRGVGKSFGIEKYAKEHAYNFIKIALSEGKDETDIVGFSIRTAEGMAWLDGKVAKAFRDASNGIQTVLFLDELYRAPKRELSVLIDALTANTDGKFMLQTNRVLETSDGIAQVETLYADRDMLWVCAASNIGVDYDVDMADKAFQDRFRTKYLDNMTEEEIKNVIRGYDIPTEKKKEIMSLWEACDNAVEAKMIENVLSVRHASELAYSVQQGKDLEKCFLDLTPQLCGRNIRGLLNKTDIDTVKEIARGIF